MSLVAEHTSQGAAGLAQGQSRKKEAIRLTSLDGLRGLAALYVLLLHSVTLVEHSATAPFSLSYVRAFFHDGLYAVMLFIVLSGFCLMIPMATSPDGKMSGGLGKFFYRRSRRILPAYYAALALSLILIAIVPGKFKGIPTSFSSSLRVTSGDVVSHLFLLQNARSDWFITIDGPMWSICIEWQIYFLFAFALLPIWRRLGSLGALAAGVAIPVAIRHFTRGYYDFSQLFFITLFTVGMIGSAHTFAIRQAGSGIISGRLKAIRRYLTFCAVVIFVGVIWIEQSGGPARFLPRSQWIANAANQILFAAGVACVLAKLSLYDGRPPRWSLAALLDSRPVQILGQMSYSMYLINYPLMWACFLVVVSIIPSTDGRLAAMLCIAVPLVIAISYAFYRVAERPFLSPSRPPAAEQK